MRARLRVLVFVSARTRLCVSVLAVVHRGRETLLDVFSGNIDSSALVSHQPRAALLDNLTKETTPSKLSVPAQHEFLDAFLRCCLQQKLEGDGVHSSRQPPSVASGAVRDRIKAVVAADAHADPALRSFVTAAGSWLLPRIHEHYYKTQRCSDLATCILPLHRDPSLDSAVEDESLLTVIDLLGSPPGNTKKGSVKLYGVAWNDPSAISERARTRRTGPAPTAAPYQTLLKYLPSLCPLEGTHGHDSLACADVHLLMPNLEVKGLERHQHLVDRTILMTYNKTGMSTEKVNITDMAATLLEVWPNFVPSLSKGQMTKLIRSSPVIPAHENYQVLLGFKRKPGYKSIAATTFSAHNPTATATVAPVRAPAPAASSSDPGAVLPTILKNIAGLEEQVEQADSKLADMRQAYAVLTKQRDALQSSLGLLRLMAESARLAERQEAGEDGEDGDDDDEEEDDEDDED